MLLARLWPRKPTDPPHSATSRRSPCAVSPAQSPCSCCSPAPPPSRRPSRVLRPAPAASRPRSCPTTAARPPPRRSARSRAPSSSPRGAGSWARPPSSRSPRRRGRRSGPGVPTSIATRFGPRSRMTWVPREERRAAGGPSASLLRINRNALSNILVVGGAPTERAAIAGALHRDSRLRGHPFCVTASGSYEGLLRRSLLSWLGHDAVGALPADVQRLRLALACGRDGVRAEGRKGPGPARLAAGSAEEPAAHVEAGRLLAALHDSLDKLTIHLGTSRSEQATLGDAGGAAAARPGRSAP